MANLRLPGRSALTLAPPLSTTNIRARSRRAPATAVPTHFMLTFDLLCPAWAERADRRPTHVPGCRAAPSPRRRRPGGRHHRSQILVPPPVLYSQIPFPTEYPDGFTTFTPSIATTPCPHTSVTAPPSPLSRPLEDCEGCPVLAGVRNLGLDDPSAGRSDLHCNFGVRSSRAASSGCSAQSRVRSSGGVPAELFVGTNGRRLRSAWPPPKSKRALRFSSLADPMPRSLPALPGRQAVPP